MVNPTFFPIDPDRLEETARALAGLAASEVESALEEAARTYAETLSSRHPDLPRFVMEYNGRHFARQAARRASQIALRLGK